MLLVYTHDPEKIKADGGIIGINCLDKILQLIPSLNFADTKRLKNSVKEKLDSDIVGKVIAEREQVVSDCPHCHSMEFVKHGVTAKGIQRYRCKGCKKTFCSLTGTPLLKMRKEDKWLAYVALMWDGVSLRKIARHLKINLRTAFSGDIVSCKCPINTNQHPLQAS
ncbi:transposase-like zinc-binding domain-containing protein [Vibrio natriegens]|uniref:transposase-like zinc-binding domain-containing protein n=1 Tax=Vibrio natriegens TaxID=691 RepID=UPI001FB8B330|nr:IS1 family transposase [Vibrio natriegens]